MSGHSKWSSIKHKKGAADSKRGQLFSKLSRAIIVAAKEGGPDPAGNLALQNAIEKARSYSMPKDNIERAIAKGSGADADAASFETVVYEGYGPDGVAVLVEAVTDNRNRTASEVRHAFTKHGGNLGTTGAVAWQFERRGVVLVAAESANEDDLVLAAADAGADDVELDGSSFVVTCAPEALSSVREALAGAGYRGRVGRARDGAEDDRGCVGRAHGAPDHEPRRGPRGHRGRPGRVRELRHPGSGAGSGRRLGRAVVVTADTAGRRADRIESLLSARLFLEPQLAGDRLTFASNSRGHLSLYAMDAVGRRARAAPAAADRAAEPGARRRPSLPRAAATRADRRA